MPLPYSAEHVSALSAFINYLQHPGRDHEEISFDPTHEQNVWRVARSWLRERGQHDAEPTQVLGLRDDHVQRISTAAGTVVTCRILAAELGKIWRGWLQTNHDWVSGGAVAH